MWRFSRALTSYNHSLKHRMQIDSRWSSFSVCWYAFLVLGTSCATWGRHVRKQVRTWASNFAAPIICRRKNVTFTSWEAKNIKTAHWCTTTLSAAICLKPINVGFSSYLLPFVQSRPKGDKVAPSLLLNHSFSSRLLFCASTSQIPSASQEEILPGHCLRRIRSWSMIRESQKAGLLIKEFQLKPHSQQPEASGEKVLGVFFAFKCSTLLMNNLDFAQSQLLINGSIDAMAIRAFMIAALLRTKNRAFLHEARAVSCFAVFVTD